MNGGKIGAGSKVLDVLEQILPGLVADGLDPLVDLFGLEGAENVSIGELSQHSPYRL